MDEQHIPYELLAKCFARQCTPEEHAEAERWRKEKPEHELVYAQLKEQWERIHLKTSAYVIPNKADVWKNIQQEIHRKAKQIPLYTRSLLIRVAGIAAAIALIGGFSLSYLFNGGDNWVASRFENVVMAPSGQKSQLLLPDGTEVWLNSGSRLSYSYEFNTLDRVVNLEGEAFFDVKKDQQHPFVVKTGMVEVKVHGTSFNVQAYTDEEDIRVALLHGKVSLLSAASQGLLTDRKSVV